MKTKKLLILGLPMLLLACSFTSKSETYNNISIKDTNLIVLLDDNKNTFDLEKELKKFTDNYEIKETYNGAIKGALVNIDSTYKELISSFDGVSGVYSDTKTILHESDAIYYDSDEILKENLVNKSLDEMNVSSSISRGENSVIAVLDTSFTLEHNAFKDLSSSTDKAISQSDITSFLSNSSRENKLSKSSEDCYYNSKIPYYHDYGGSISKAEYEKEDADGEGYVEDNDVYSSASSHGMHVSSIAAANGAMEGVAPDAQLLFLKVSTDVTGTSDTSYILKSAMIKGLNDAYLLGADIISVSIGSDNDEYNEFGEDIKDKFLEKGIQVNFAQGNEGKGSYASSGAYEFSTTEVAIDTSIGSEAAQAWVTSVASSNLSDDASVGSLVAVDGTLIKVRDQITNHTASSSTDSSTTEVKYTKQLPLFSLISEGEDEVSLEYEVIPGLGDVADYEGIDVEGKVAIVKRGTLTFADKIKNAKNKGAVAIIICNATGSGSQGYFDLTSLSESSLIPAASSNVQSYEQFDSATNKVLTIGKEMSSTFSTNGTNADLTLKPDISAPGQNILGAINNNENKETTDTYQYYSGTSMATPNYSGAEATVLSNQNFKTDEEKETYLKTLKSRMMSNATTLFQPNGAPYSPRRQGAGVVNVGNTISSNMYLEGNSEYGSKIELKNNEDIASGRIKFETKLINDGSKSGTYKAKLYVTCAGFGYIDSETSEDLSIYKLVSNYSDLLETYEFDVKVSGKETAISVDYTLSDDSIAYLNENFKYGTILEGFLVLEGSSSLTDLSIPYIGYFGDYSSSPAVEPFNFEKDSNTVYQSDLVNSTSTNVTGFAGNFSSTICLTTGGLSGISGISEILYNTADPESIYSPVSVEVIDGKTHIYCGTSNSATLYIQQFVNRTVKDNVLTLTNSNGKVVLTDHMFSMIYGEADDGSHPLGKTMIVSSLSSSGILADRAYTILPLKDKANNKYYEDGSYDLKFEYTLMDGSVQTKEYVLEIGKAAETPVITPNSYSLNDTTFTISFNVDIASVYVNNKKASLNGNNSFSIALDSDEIGISFFIKVRSSSGELLKGITSNDYNLILWGSEVASGYSFSYKLNTQTIDGTKTNVYKLTLRNNVGAPVSIDGGDYNLSILEGNIANTYNVDSSNFVPGEKLNTNANINTILYIVIGGSVVIIAGVVVVIFVVINKKKKGEE